MLFNLNGNAGVAGATVSWAGTSSGSVTADGSGNFSAPGVLTSGGDYTITASLALYTFSPSSGYFYSGVNQNLTYDFTATPIPNASVVQKAVQINTTGADTATATFANALTKGNGIIVAVMAVDTGGAIGTDAHGSGAATNASVTDSQGNTLAVVGDSPSIYGDRTNNKTLFVGIYFINSLGNSGIGAKAASDAVTFTFTPVSSAGNCQVGIVAYEVAGFAGGSVDTSASPKSGENGSSGAFPGVFPPRVIGDITYISQTYGAFVVVCAAATTSDGSTFSVGSENAFDPYSQGAVGELGWSLDASEAAFINGTHTTLAVQSEFATGTGADNPCEFGSSPSSIVGIASVACALGFPLANVPAMPNPPTITTKGLSNATLSQSYSAALAATGGTPAYLWSISSGSLPAGLSLNSSSGVISGTPTIGGNFFVTVKVTDSLSQTATQGLALDIVAFVGGFHSQFRLNRPGVAVAKVNPPKDFRPTLR